MGDTKIGRDWLEEFETSGYISNSMGPLKVPLLIPNSRSTGGGHILDHCIVRIKDFRTGRELYRHPKYHHGVFAIKEATNEKTSVRTDEPQVTLRSLGYTHLVTVDGDIHASFKTLKAAERWVKKME